MGRHDTAPHWCCTRNFLLALHDLIPFQWPAAFGDNNGDWTDTVQHFRFLKLKLLGVLIGSESDF